MSMEDHHFTELGQTVARIEVKVDSQQEILSGQRVEMGKISDAIVTIARLDEHLLHFREEDRVAKQRLWAAIEGQDDRIRNVEEITATMKDQRNFALALIIAIGGAMVAGILALFQDTP